MELRPALKHTSCDYGKIGIITLSPWTEGIGNKRSRRGNDDLLCSREGSVHRTYLLHNEGTNGVL